MSRSLCLVPLVALLSVACGPREPQCGELSTVDRSDCDLGSLAMLEREGTWNMQVVPGPDNGEPFFAHFSLIRANPSINGAPIVFNETDDGEFSLGTHLMTMIDGREVLLRRTFAGCVATDPQHFTGKVLVCADDDILDQGTFTAARIGRAPDEAEGSGLKQVVLEKPLSGSPAHVTVYDAGEKVYALATRSGSAGLLAIYDVTAPPAGGELALVKELAVADDTWNHSLVKSNANGTALYVASALKGMLVYDFSDPANPTLLGNRPGSQVTVYAFAQDPSLPDRLYAVAPGPGAEVLIFDVSNPLNPTLEGRFKAEGADAGSGLYPLNAAAFGGRLYVNYNGLGLVIADVTNAAAPVELGRYFYPGQLSHATAVGQIGDKVIAFEGGSTWGSHLRAIDVTDPANLQLIGQVEVRPETSIDDLVLRGTKIYASWNQAGVRVFDVANPSAMTQVAYFNTWDGDTGRGLSPFEGATSIAVDDRYVYATDNVRGLFVLEEVP